jgi:hypothetical protein
MAAHEGAKETFVRSGILIEQANPREAKLRCLVHESVERFADAQVHLRLDNDREPAPELPFEFLFDRRVRENDDRVRLVTDRVNQAQQVFGIRSEYNYSYGDLILGSIRHHVSILCFQRRYPLVWPRSWFRGSTRTGRDPQDGGLT